MNRKRAESPSSSIPQRRSKSPTGRSSSVPHSPTSSPHGKEPTSARSYDDVFEEILKTLETKTFLQAKKKATVITQLKNIRQTVSKYFRMKSEKIAIDFWQNWRAFQALLKDELGGKITQTKTAIDRYLVQLEGALATSQDKKLDTETIYEVIEITRSILSSPMEGRTVINVLNQWRRVQGDVSENAGNSFGVTSAISNIVTQLTNAKEVVTTQPVLVKKFEEIDELLAARIPCDVQEKSPTKKPANEVKKKSGIPSPRKPPISPVQEAKRQKQAESDENSHKIEILQRELEELEKQETKLSMQLKEHQSLTIDEDTLVPLRIQKRDLEEETVKLDATIQRLIEQIEDSTIADIYRENAELRQQRADMNKQLLNLRERCLRMNSVSQKAALFTQNSNFNPETIYNEYQAALEENEKASSKRNALAIELEGLEREREALLFEKYYSESSDTSAMDELLKLKHDYKVKKAEYLRRQHRTQTNAALALKRTTEETITRLHQEAISRLKEPQSRIAELTEQYDELRDAYNETVREGGDIVYDEGNDIVTVDDARETLEDLSQEYASVMETINQINMEEIEGEKEAIQNEIDRLEEGNNDLVKWISQVQQNSMEAQAELQTLTIQYQLLEKKASDQTFDIESAFDSALEQARANNEQLKKHLAKVLEELANLDVDLHGSAEDMSVEERILSLGEKFNYP